MGKVTISLFLCLLLCDRTIFNFPTNNDNRAYLNSEDEETAKSEVKDEKIKNELMSTTAPSPTLISSIQSTNSERKDDTKQPSSKSMPTVTPAKPMEHASNSPTPLHIKSVAPIKSMNKKGIDPNLNGDNSFDDPGCIDICHSTEIHPVPDTKVPNEELRKVLPSLPDMIAPLKDKEPGSCCVWKCGKCNVTICKTSKSACLPTKGNDPDTGCNEKNEKCAGLAIKTNSDKFAELEPQVNNEKCTCAVCQGINDECPAKSPNNIEIVQALEKCPFTCSSPALTSCNNNCPFTMEYAPDDRFPQSITRCNNNYLGKNLDNGGVPRPDDGDKNVEAYTVRQPTTRKVSTSSPLVGMKQITANAHADAGSYNPIQAMPTQPVLGPDDLIIHNIFVAEPYTTQNPLLDGSVG